MLEKKRLHNASKPALDEGATEALLDDAREMLQRAWDNPDLLGESSDIFAQAINLHTDIRQHATPSDNNEAFLQALKLSWLAVWRARDYSLLGFQRRSEAENWDWNQRVFASDSYNLVREYRGALWFPMHFPIFDSDGQRIEDNVQRHSVRKYYNRPHPRFWEGAMLLDAIQLQDRPNNSLQWSWIQMPLPATDGGWTLESSVFDAGNTEFECQRNPIPSCQNTIFFSRAAYTGFVANNMDALMGARFELGLALRNGEFVRDVDVPTMETGSELELTQIACRENFSLNEKRFGVRMVTAKNWRVARTVRLRPAERLALSWVEEQNGTTGGIDFAQAKFSTFELNGLQVSGAAQFSGADVSESYVVRSCTFSKGTFFNGAHLGSPNSRTSVTFTNCVFRQEAVFRKAKFGFATRFDYGQFQAADFRGAEFGSSSSFLGVAFSAELDMSKFEDVPVVFVGDVDFRGAGDGSSSIFTTVDFTGAEFRSRVNFRNREFTDDTSFNDAKFSHPPSFHGSKFHPRTTFGRTSFIWRRARPSTRLQRIFGARWNTWRRKTLSPVILADNDFLAEVSDSFRVLTTLAKQIDAPELAYRFHREELRGRHHRAVHGGVSRAEAVIGRLYGMIADYGDSFLRPIIGLVASLVAFATAYSSMAYEGSDRWLSAAVVSGSIQLKPFSHIDAAFGRVPTEEQRSQCEKQLTGVGRLSTVCLSAHLVDDHELQFKGLATVQSILSVAFIFLAALGLRRKYQVG